MTTELNEYVLDDNYPVYPGYWYVVDGEPQESNIEGTVKEMKALLKAKEIRSCDAVGRKLPLFGW